MPLRELAAAKGANLLGLCRDTLTVQASKRVLRPVLEIKRQEVLPGIYQLLVICDGVAIYAIKHLGQMIVAAITVNHLLNLAGVELHVVKNCSVGSERSEDTVITKVLHAVVVLCHGGHELRKGGLLLSRAVFVREKTRVGFLHGGRESRKIGLVLRRLGIVLRKVRVQLASIVVTYGRKRHNGCCKDADHKCPNETYHHLE